MKPTSFLRFAALFALLLSPAGAATISFQAIDRPDTVAGDIWRYEYTLDGFLFQADEAWSVLFDPALYGELVAWGGGNSDWDVTLALQPDPGLPALGRFEPYALINLPSLANNFFIDFVFLGVAPPASQPYEIIRYTTSNPPEVIGIGATAPGSSAVPEPGTLSFLLTGAGAIATALAVRGRRRPSVPRAD